MFIKKYFTDQDTSNQSSLHQALENASMKNILVSKGGDIPVTMFFLLAKEGYIKIIDKLNNINKQLPNESQLKCSTQKTFDEFGYTTVAGEIDPHVQLDPTIRSEPTASISGGTQYSYYAKATFDESFLQSMEKAAETDKSIIIENGYSYFPVTEIEPIPSILIYMDYYQYCDNCYKIKERIDAEISAFSKKSGNDPIQVTLGTNFNNIVIWRESYTHYGETNLFVDPSRGVITINRKNELKDTIERSFIEMCEWIQAVYGEMLKQLPA